MERRKTETSKNEYRKIPLALGKSKNSSVVKKSANYFDVLMTGKNCSFFQDSDTASLSFEECVSQFLHQGVFYLRYNDMQTPPLHPVNKTLLTLPHAFELNIRVSFLQ